MQSSNFLAALFLACAIHGLLAALLLITPPLIPERQDKSIPVLLVSSQKAAIKQQTSQSQPNRVEERITTQGLSDFTEIQSTTDKITSPVRKLTDAPELPSFSSPSRKQANRSQKNSSGIKELFSQDKTSVANHIQQLSNSDLPPLSNYELSLLQKLAVNELYNDYPKVLENNKKDRIDFTIEMILFANGAIKTARIFKSSEIDAVDQLAIQTAYNASPFDRPPQKDSDKGFRYLIPISYQNQKP